MRDGNKPSEKAEYREFLLEDWLSLSERAAEEAFNEQLRFVSKRLNLGLPEGLEKQWREKSEKFLRT